jgi:hypothetical protein
MRESAGEAMRRRLLALWAGLALVGASCSGAHHHAAPPTTASGPDPDVIPAVITPAYVDAVFRVLNHIDGDASRALLAAGKVTPGVLTDLRAIYNDPLYAQEVKIAQQSISGDTSNVRRPPGDVIVGVVQLVSGTGSCIFVATKSDFSAVLIHTGPPAPSEYYELRRKAPGNDPMRINPTPWAFSFDVVYPTPTSVPDQCGSS